MQCNVAKCLPNVLYMTLTLVYSIIWVYDNRMSFFLQATLTNKFIFQAIKLNPNDAETYYQRAAMFKMVRSIIVF